MGGRTVSGEKTRGLGGCRRGAEESAIGAQRDPERSDEQMVLERLEGPKADG